MHDRFIMGALTLALAISGCRPPVGQPRAGVQSRAYAGHENDRDVGRFVSQYPEAAGTRLDDCQTCHRGGVAQTDTEREYSPCGYCHLLEFPKPKYATGVPSGYEDTLNAYGLAYKENGRNAGALRRIADHDSDGDGFPNAVEILQGRRPGDAASRPGQPLAPAVTYGWEDIRSLPSHTQFLLLNRTTEDPDLYLGYTGVRVRDLLEGAGVDLGQATGITVFAPDGFSIDYALGEVLEPFPKGRFYAGPVPAADGRRLVLHPGTLPPGVEDGREIPDTLWLLLAYEQDGAPLRTARYEADGGRLSGDGPYRLVKPQAHLLGDALRPGRPDRAAGSERRGDGWDFGADIDHNAGNCVRGASAIRINPMPEGFEEYDWKNGWPLVDAREIVLFGAGIAP